MFSDIHYYDSLTSTQDEAWRLAEAGAPEGTVVCAARQQAGRGRHERAWDSPEGNLHATVILAPAAPQAACPQLALVTAVALADTLAAYTPAAVTVKWPNDVLIDGRKAAGILLETRRRGDGYRVLAGVGVNLRHYPEGALWPATALAEHVSGEVPSVDAFLARFGGALAHHYGQWQERGLEPVRARWLARSFAAVGQPATVRLPGGALEGRFEGLDNDGGLVLRLEDGEKTTIHAGDVFFEDKPCS